MTHLEYVTMLARLRLARANRTKIMVWGIVAALVLQFCWVIFRPANTDHTAEPQYECTPICGNHK